MTIGMGIAIAGTLIALATVWSVYIYVDYLQDLRIHGKKEFIND